jgi:hypothetical protein
MASGTTYITYTKSNSCSKTVTVTVNANVICATYNGDYFKNTGSTSTGGSATVTLIYNITGTGSCNNISGLAASDFTISSDAGGNVSYGAKTYNSGVLTIPATITLAPTAYSITVQFTLGINNSNFTFGACLDVPLVTVSTKSGDFLTGGGFVIPTNSYSKKLNSNANGLKNSFGFNVKWNKSFTNLQGNFNTIN